MHESKPLAKCDGFYSDLPSLPSDVEELKLLHQKFESMCRIDANKGKNMAENSEPVNSEVSTKSKPKSTTLPPLRKSTTVSKALSASFTTSNTVNVGPNFCEEVNAAYSLALVFETRGLLKYNPVEIEKCPSTTEDIVDSLRSLPLGTDSESRLPSTLSNVTPLLSQNGNGNTSTTVLQQITIIQIPPPQTAAGTKEASTKASQLLHPEQEDTDKKFELDDVIHVYKTLHRPQTIPMFDVRKGESLKQLCSLWNSTEPPAREYLWHFVNVFGEEIFVPLSKEKRLLHGTDFWNQTKSKNWSNWEVSTAVC
ncbi:hypothetical protein BCR33DRAFT_92986 [Rhizoclosmatium globosum]|uniref:Uncharacterized protein n=1 Tax=Rhizoclosmatium globosum TaxID=329046 RepID=A0A1Y2CJQ0_9FUNG|nr:hypothetical protein BCR33DRAFT_92986 [Rhizoclosmatium globosum]|eukprot:ORY47253.1 hypothetical protein BCR33DRAFT_92986 [Rhizoclosmatium globosum]